MVRYINNEKELHSAKQDLGWRWSREIEQPTETCAATTADTEANHNARQDKVPRTKGGAA